MSRTRTRLVAGLAVVAAAAATTIGLLVGGSPAGAVTAPMPPPAPVAGQPDSYGAVAASRLLDTRLGVGAPKAAVGPGASLAVQVTGRAGVPNTNVSSVLVMVAAISPTSAGAIQVHADGTSAGTQSVITLVPGTTVTNLVMAPLGSDGKTVLRNNSSGTVHLIADLSGYYRGGSSSVAGTMHPVTSSRLLDTRSGLGAPTGAVRAGGSVSVQMTGRGGIPTTNVAAVVLNVTATQATKSGYLTAWAAGTSKPGSSALSYVPGRTDAALVVVPVGSSGAISLANNSAGTTHFIADVFGYVTGGTPTAASVFAPVTPSRLVDTRYGIGHTAGAVHAHGVIAVPVAGRNSVPATGVGAVVISVSAVAPTSLGSITVWGDGQATPATSNFNYFAGRSTTELVVAPVGADGAVAFANNSGGTVQISADVVGYYRSDPASVTTSTSRYVRNLTGAASDVTTMHDEGCSDAQGVAAAAQNLMLLDIGGQNTVNGVNGVQLTAVAQTLTDAQVVTAVNGYVDGYLSCRAGVDPAYIAVATNNDGNLRDAAAGTDWADHVIDPIAAHAAGAEGLTIAGANDIEPDFTGLESEAEAWTRAFLAATSAPYVFIGAASGCPTSGTAACNFGWTRQNFYALAHGISPTRILALPQIYYAVNAQQWRYIAQAGAAGADRISFLGTLSEYAACQTQGSGCDLNGLLTATQSWQALRSQLSSVAAVDMQRLPVSTDLRIDSAPGAPMSAKRVTTAGVR